MTCEVISDPTEINEIFCAFYTDLYSQCLSDIWVGDKPFDWIAFPKINEDLCRELGGQVSIKEVQEAPGLQRTYNDSFADGRLPSPCWRPRFHFCSRVAKTLFFVEAIYRPIQLLNVDLMILSKLSSAPSMCPVKYIIK